MGYAFPMLHHHPLVDVVADKDDSADHKPDTDCRLGHASVRVGHWVQRLDLVATTILQSRG